MKSKKLIVSKLPRNGAFYAIVVFVLFFAFKADNYFTLGNMINLLRQASVFAIITACLFLAVLTKQTDLSVGATASLSSVFMAMSLQAGAHPVVGILVALATGVLMGAFNGILISRTTIAPFIITMSTMYIGESIGLIVTKGITVPVTSPAILAISKYEVFGLVPICVILMAAIFLALAYLMRKRSFGTALYAIGGNPEAALATGISVKNCKFVIFVMNGVMAAIAGIILAARIGTANPSQGVGLEFEGICGAVLGGTALSGGRGSVGGAFLGALAIAVMKNGLNMLGLKTGYQMVVLGGIVLVILALDTFTNSGKGDGKN